MKVTQYFAYTQTRPDRSTIKRGWIFKAINKPFHEETQSDGRIRKWVYIAEESKWLRVILLEDGTTLHNAFFDRRFKPEKKQ